MFPLIAFVSMATSTAMVEVETTRATSIKAGWSLFSDACPKQELALSFGVRLQNTEKLTQIFEAVSDPRHKMYRRYLSSADLDALTRPKPQSIAVVKEFINTHFKNVTLDESVNGYINVRGARVSEIESAFACDMQVFKHDTTNATATKTLKYFVPEDVAQHLDFVAGLTRLPRLTKARAPKVDAEAVAEKRQNIPWPGITPRIVRARYNVTGVTPKAKQNRQAIAQFLEQYYDLPDLQEFFLLMYQELLGSSPSKTLGPNTWYYPGIESNLDVQYIMSVSAGVDTWVFSTPDLHDGQEPFLVWLQSMGNISDADVPKVISVSYGDDEDSISPSYALRCEVEFQKLGLRGVSIMFAAGDSGADCRSSGNVFRPDWPASSPSVTTIGGTTTQGAFETGPEVADYIGGSGFSNIFKQPKYQQQAVADYIAAAQIAGTLPAAHFYNASGRAYPDAAAFSENFWIVYSLIPTTVAGTSCASPSFSAIVSLLNDYVMQQNNPPLGFLNPLLYQAGPYGAYHDVTQGCNAGCQSNKGNGFCALKGFDLPSGWGSIDYQGMLALI